MLNLDILNNWVSKNQLIIRLMAFCPPILNNVVASGLLANQTDLNLSYIASKMEGSRLNSKKFPGLIIRKTKPKGTIILFKSNKFLLIGVNSIDECEVLALKVAKDLKRVTNTNISVKKFRVTNLIANASLGFKINICSLAEQVFAYKDDKFSGVYLKTQEFKAAVVFGSGKIIMNGFTEMSQLEKGFQKIQLMLKKYEIDEKKGQILEANKSEKKKNRKNKGKKKQNMGQVSHEENNIFDDSTNCK